MTTTIGQFIQEALWSHYRGETILDYSGDPFVVWSVQVEADMDGFHAHFGDRDHNGKSGEYPYQPPTWSRSQYLGLNDPMPSIVNLLWSEETLSWLPRKPKHEREEEKRKERIEMEKRSEEAAAKIREGSVK